MVYRPVVHDIGPQITLMILGLELFLVFLAIVALLIYVNLIESPEFQNYMTCTDTGWNCHGPGM